MDVIQTVLPEHLHPAAAKQRSESVPEVSSQATVVDAVTHIFDPDSTSEIRDAFDRCIDKLSQLVHAYQVQTSTWGAHVTRERLSPIIPYVVASHDLEDKWDSRGLRLLSAHQNFPTPSLAPELNSDDMRDVGFVLQRIYQGDPSVAFRERIYHAQYRLYRDGDYMGSIIHAQIAAEIFFDSVLGMLLWEDNVSPQDAAVLFEAGLTKRVQSHFHPRLGGTWDSAKAGPIQDWEQDLYTPPRSNCQVDDSATRLNQTLILRRGTEAQLGGSETNPRIDGPRFAKLMLPQLQFHLRQ